MARKIIKSKLIQFYEGDEDLIKAMNINKTINFNELFKQLLRNWIQLIQDQKMV